MITKLGVFSVSLSALLLTASLNAQAQSSSTPRQVQPPATSNSPSGTPRAVKPEAYNTVDPTVVAKQRTFTVGNRPQRVRFLLGGTTDSINQFFNGAAQVTQIARDTRGTSNNEGLGFARFCANGAAMGYQAICESNTVAGIIVNPRLIMCASETLKLVEEAGNALPEVLARWQIDEINIIVYPVNEQPEDKHYAVSIDTVQPVTPPPANTRPVMVDPALNVRVPFSIQNDRCEAWPSTDLLKETIVRAGSKPVTIGGKVESDQTQNRNR